MPSLALHGRVPRALACGLARLCVRVLAVAPSSLAVWQQLVPRWVVQALAIPVLLHCLVLGAPVLPPVPPSRVLPRLLELPHPLPLALPVAGSLHLLVVQSQSRLLVLLLPVLPSQQLGRQLQGQQRRSPSSPRSSCQLSSVPPATRSCQGIWRCQAATSSLRAQTCST